MKKTNRKLVLRTETVRALSSSDLTRAAGGWDSGDKQGACVIGLNSHEPGCVVPVAATGN